MCQTTPLVTLFVSSCVIELICVFMICFKGAGKNSGYVENSRIIIEFEPEGLWKEVVVTKFEVIPHSVLEQNHCKL